MSGFQVPTKADVKALLDALTGEELATMDAEIQAARKRVYMDAMDRWVRAGWVRDPEAAVAGINVKVCR